MADNGVEFTLNGSSIGGYLPPYFGDDFSAFQVLRDVTLSAVPWIEGVNILEARVTNYGGPTGLLLDGWTVIC